MKIKRISINIPLTCVYFASNLWTAGKSLISKSHQPISLPCQEGHSSGCVAMVLPHLPLYFLLLFLSSILTAPHDTWPTEAAAGPVLEDRPFVVVWNMPTAQCRERYNIHLDLRDFDIVENREQLFQGQVMELSGWSSVPPVGRDHLLQIYYKLGTLYVFRWAKQHVWNEFPVCF